LVYLVREEEVEQTHFFLAQYACPISKSLKDITRLLANIQNKWLEFYLEELKLLKDRNVYEVVVFHKKRKVI